MARARGYRNVLREHALRYTGDMVRDAGYALMHHVLRYAGNVQGDGGEVLRHAGKVLLCRMNRADGGCRRYAVLWR